jgi:hypothetical protein
MRKAKVGVENTLKKTKKIMDRDILQDIVSLNTKFAGKDYT